ncbi:MAG: response regulator transcription factor, partial [Romboutsia sp.]|nr:response regulator transcription factor [Romboutsia sp.]
ISKELFITEHTVKKHTSNIFSKLNLKDRMQAALYAYNNGIIGF